MPQGSKNTDDPRQARTVQSIKTTTKRISANKTLMEVKTCHSKLNVSIVLNSDDFTKIVCSVVPGQTQTFRMIALVNFNKHGYEFKNYSFDDISNDAKKYWQNFWQNSDIEITGDSDLNQAIHYNIFQLASSAGRNGETNVAAKGLSGTGYEGHYFWDTEMYMLPFFTYTNPEIAKQLLIYRFNILDEAQKRAGELGVTNGALFAWRTINGKEASAYYPAGTAQYHINGDIAYAINRYYAVTGDDEFMEKYGLRLLVETARFWQNFGSWSTVNGQRQFEFFDVTGPDEYTAIVNNNYYTNRMAKHNLAIAAQMIQQFKKTAIAIGVTPEETKHFELIAKNVRLPYSEELKINEQDDSAFQKPIWPFETTPKDHYPLLLHYHPLTIYRYQVNKQADTLLADYLFPEDLGQEQLQREYKYYEKITTHDSSLSRSIFSALAARMGDDQKAFQYFMDTAKMDLIDLQGNAKDGLHVANLGGSWLSIVTGFGGVQIKNKQLFIENHLPNEWTALKVRLQYQGRLLEINYNHEKTTVQLISGKPFEISVDGKVIQVK